MIELSKKYRTRGGCPVELTRISHGYVSGIYRHDETDSGYPGVWSQHDGRAYWPSSEDVNLIEVKPSAIEEMIAWLEMHIEIEDASTYTGAVPGDALDKARRIRDSNATSDE